VGLRFRRNRSEHGKLVPTDETFERRGAYVVSSIGSIPEPMAGVPSKGELFAFSDWEVGRLPGYTNVFSVGNVVTGKGNIVASRKHATAVTEKAIEAFLGLGDAGASHAGEEVLAEAASAAAAQQAEAVAKQVDRTLPRPAAEVDRILARVRERQKAVGYEGDLAAWLEKVTPPDLE